MKIIKINKNNWTGETGIIKLIGKRVFSIYDLKFRVYNVKGLKGFYSVKSIDGEWDKDIELVSGFFYKNTFIMVSGGVERSHDDVRIASALALFNTI